MRRLLSFLLVTCICFGLVGCNKANNTTSSNLSSTETNTNKNESNKVKIIRNGKEEVLTSKQNDDNRLEGIGEIIDMVTSPRGYRFDSLVITAEGKLYEITNGEKPFSNGKYYKEILSEFHWLRFWTDNNHDGGSIYVIDTNFNLYSLGKVDNHFTISNVLNDLDVYISYDSLKNYVGKKEIANICFSTSPNFDFYIVRGNKIYGENELLFSIPDNEIIERVTNNLIKTDKKYYYISLIRIASEYADVDDTYEIVLNEIELKERGSLYYCYVMNSNSGHHILINGENIFYIDD